mgnify:CR=1 FL=1
MRANLIKTNFTAGEISPRLMGRVDIERYANGAKIIENGLCVVQGGVMRRPGTRYAAAAKYGDRTARLIPYVFNRSQAYVLEFGDGYLRFYQNGQQLVNGDNTPYEIASPYSVDMLSEVNYVQAPIRCFWCTRAYHRNDFTPRATRLGARACAVHRRAVRRNPRHAR